MSAPSPVYRSGRAEVYVADCRDVLPHIDPCDLLITDPPYGVRYVSNQSDNHGPIHGDEDDTVAREMLGLVRVRDYRHLYMFWSQRRPRPPIDGTPFAPWEPLIWDKVNTTSGSLWARSHEEILFTAESKRRSVRKRADLAARLRRGTVLRCPRPNSAQCRRHPTEKPIPLLREIIEMSSRPGEVVLDPFAGVGSTAVAAILEGRRAVCVEVDRAFALTAIRRIEAAERIAEASEGL